MNRTLKNFKLLDPQKVKDDRIEKNKLKYFLGGYGGGSTTYTITCQGQNSIGCCNTYTCKGSCSWCRTKAIEDGCIDHTIQFSPSCD